MVILENELVVVVILGISECRGNLARFDYLPYIGS